MLNLCCVNIALDTLWEHCLKCLLSDSIVLPKNPKKSTFKEETCLPMRIPNYRQPTRYSVDALEWYPKKTLKEIL